MRLTAPMIALLALCIAISVTAKSPTGPSLVLVTDGSPVHDAGELLLHMPNWGMFGSLPTASFPFSSAPSAEWPAGSNVEYLYAGGLWVGAVDQGIPAVSTAVFDFEYRPAEDPVDRVYYTAEGAPGGSRLPSPNADDDGDGMIDEDPLDGHDNDGDGDVDEDFAAISDQMLARWYTDDQPGITDIYPDHTPMHLMVREHSYQWSDPDYDDFIGVDYEITNTGPDVLEDVYIGTYFDPDVGVTSNPNYWSDDGAGFAEVPMPGGGSYDFAYGYDVDGDGGTATGDFGVVILDHPTDPAGVTAPARVGAATFAVFSGEVPFEEGGDPTNDFERYQLMSSETIERSPVVPADFRVMVCAGPFASLSPGETIRFRIALVATPHGGAFENVVNAATVYEGEVFDVGGQVQRVHWWLPGQEPPAESKTAEMRVTPRVLNFNSHAGVLRARVMLPSGYSVSDVDESSLRLLGSIPGTILRTTGERTFVVEFSTRSITTAPPSDDFEARVTFTAAGDPFVALDYIRVVGGHGPRRASGAAGLRASNAPNPFNPATTISFDLPAAAAVALDIYAADGRLVRRLVSGHYAAGTHNVPWRGIDDAGGEVASGIYFYRLRAGDGVITKKMVLIK